MHLLLSILFACADDPVPDPAAYAHALAAVDAAPAAAAELCGTLRAPALRGDCLTAGAEKLARQDPDAAAALCAKLPIGLHRDECGFQVA
ncbi:MAG: hypothetical protein VX265_15170, partial [Myxococcota bacterium]|nr:hypothetical protein [Myxococcota bacterium]